MSDELDPVIEELERIRGENAGSLQAMAVVEAAASAMSPLHALFEWDDHKGGHEYRLVQARRLIRVQVRKVQPGDPTPVRTYFNVEKDGERSYRHVDEVIADDELRAQAYRKLLAELHACRRRLRTYAAYAGQLGPVVTAIDQALRGLEEGEAA